VISERGFAAKGVFNFVESSLLTTWLLILGSCTSALGQAGVPQGPDQNTGLLSSVEQREKGKTHQNSRQIVRILLTAKTVLVVGESFVLYPTSKTEQTFKKALAKWGRFHLVDDVETADLIIVVSGYSSSKPMRMERVREELSVFVGGSTPNIDATPLWAAKEVGPALGQRPTGKLVEDLQETLSELEKYAQTSDLTRQ
jgi:hypothetical protein